MKKRCLVVALVLAASSVMTAAEGPGGRSIDSPVSGPSPTPSPGRPVGKRARPVRPAVDASPKATVADPYNHTQAQVVSVDINAGTMTFVDVEGETNTWQFEPAGLARDPLLKPGARVTIVWKSDASGQPIPKMLGVVAFNRQAGAPASNMAARGRPQRARPSPGPSPSASPSAAPPRGR